MPGAEAMRRAGIKPVKLGPKDGIALVSANSASLGSGALVLHDAAVVLQAQRAALALSLEGFRGNPDPFDPRLANVRAAPGQAEAAAAVLKLLKGGALMKPRAARRVQDPLSFRCFPSVHGAAMSALASAMLVLEQELNRVTTPRTGGGRHGHDRQLDITAPHWSSSLGRTGADRDPFRPAHAKPVAGADRPAAVSPRGAMHAGVAGLGRCRPRWRPTTATWRTRARRWCRRPPTGW
jgi:hypothetical protein